jgi:Zn-dependent peptidase ImmA (M78 family)/transcriptional regulator with XRE-family HTH domain
MIKKIIGQKIEVERKRAGLSLEEVAKKIGLSRQTLSLVENGESIIDSEKLLHFARLVGRPISFFFEEKTPEVQLFFRADSAKEITSGLEDSLKERYRRYVELEEILGIKPCGQLPQSMNLRTFSGSDKEIIGDVAKQERKRLGIGDAPINNIFELFENNGIKIFVFDFGNLDLFGVTCYNEKNGTCIFVNGNTKIPGERQIFTVAHEYGHLIFHRDEFVDQDTFKYRKGVGKGKVPEEKIADYFAGIFLVPEEHLRKLVPIGYRITIADIIYIKRIFSVSFKTILERLLQCGLITSKEKSNFYGLLISSGFEKQEPHPLSKEELGFNKRFENLLRNAYENELISVNKVAELYGKNIREVRELIRAWGELGSGS